MAQAEKKNVSLFACSAMVCLHERMELALKLFSTPASLMKTSFSISAKLWND